MSLYLLISRVTVYSTISHLLFPVSSPCYSLSVLLTPKWEVDPDGLTYLTLPLTHSSTYLFLLHQIDVLSYDNLVLFLTLGQ